MNGLWIVVLHREPYLRDRTFSAEPEHKAKLRAKVQAEIHDNCPVHVDEQVVHVQASDYYRKDNYV